MCGFILICKPRIDKASKHYALHQLTIGLSGPSKMVDHEHGTMDKGMIMGPRDQCSPPYSPTLAALFKQSKLDLQEHVCTQKSFRSTIWCGTGFLQIKGDFTHQVLAQIRFHALHLTRVPHKSFVQSSQDLSILRRTPEQYIQTHFSNSKMWHCDQLARRKAYESLNSSKTILQLVSKVDLHLWFSTFEGCTTLRRSSPLGLQLAPLA